MRKEGRIDFSKVAGEEAILEGSSAIFLCSDIKGIEVYVPLQ